MPKNYKELRKKRKEEEAKKEKRNMEKIVMQYAKHYSSAKDKTSLHEFCKKINKTNDYIKSRFKSLENLNKIARRLYPDMFKDTPIKNKKIKTKDLSGSKRFIITTAVMGCERHEGFYQSIKTYCKKNNAKMLILTSCDPRAKAGCTLDKVLSDELIVTENLKLNSNLFVNTIKLSAKQIDPITNLERIGQRKGSFIYASPKQRMKVTPTSNSKLPHVLYTTGAITIPNYQTDHYLSQRTAVIAEEDHVIGALIVEIKNNDIFHIRHIQASKDGSFVDYGTRYSPESKTKKENAAAIVFGDWHSGETDPTVISAYEQICKDVKPKYGVIHDLFNGMSINHHEKHNQLLKARRAENNELNLHKELEVVGKDLEMISKWVDKVVVTKSNHDEFLDRYLMEGFYVYSPENHRISLKIALEILDGKDPLKEGVEMACNKKFNNIKWLKRDDEFKIAGVQLAAHGDCGSNGARGSIRSMENSYGPCIVGHSHSPQILRGVYYVGTSTFLKLEYNQKGASSWIQSFCLLYNDGSRQLIHIIDGEWHL